MVQGKTSFFFLRCAFCDNITSQMFLKGNFVLTLLMTALIANQPTTMEELTDESLFCQNVSTRDMQHVVHMQEQIMA